MFVGDKFHQPQFIERNYSMTEKEMFIATWEREFATTMKVLRAFPAEKQDFKPTTEKTKSAKDLAFVFVSELSIIDGITKGQIDFMNMPKAPATYGEVLSQFESAQKQLENVKAMSESDWNATMKFMVAPKTMADVRRGDVLWTMLMDSVHHRGQFSIYLRLVGAKVPSIYGPTADEPWM
jgi:uncharacterized damage-inducible protein DinB